MDVTIITNALNFLITDYGFKYNLIENDNYLNRNAGLIANCYYNENGCFAIVNIPVIGEESFLRFENIERVKDYAAGIYSPDKNNYEFNPLDYERQIWEKHEKFLWFKNPLAWISTKKFLRVMQEVIRAQIEKHSEFFGIKIKS